MKAFQFNGPSGPDTLKTEPLELPSHGIGTIRETVHINEVVSKMHVTIEVNVVGLRTFTFRLWVVKQIIRILELVAKPIKVEVVE